MTGRLADGRDRVYFHVEVKNARLELVEPLPEYVKVPWLNIYGILDGKGEPLLKREYIRFFFIEGIVSRLRFLNPYMHIVFMIERLMTADPAAAYEIGEPTGQEKRFYEVSGEILTDIEKKCRIQMNPYELSLLYELLRRIIIEEKK